MCVYIYVYAETNCHGSKHPKEEAPALENVISQAMLPSVQKPISG